MVTTTASELRPAPSARVTTLLLDLDGTLVHLSGRARLEAALAARGAWRFAGVISPLRFYPTLWRAIRAAQTHGCALPNHEVLVQEMERASGAPEGELRKLFAAFVEEDFSRMGRHFTALPGALSTLAFAREQGFRLVLATNPVWPARAVAMRLAWAGLGHVPFDFVSHSEIMTRCKPSLAYYRELLSKVGCEAAACAMVGNDSVKDLPAAELGIRTFLLRPPDKNGRAIPPAKDRRLDAWGTHRDLRAWLSALAPPRVHATPTVQNGPRARPSSIDHLSPTIGGANPGEQLMVPKLICVTGPDGSGKTTQINRLVEHLAKNGKAQVTAVTIWDLLLDPSCKGKVLFDEPAKVDRYLSVLHPTSRALFLYHCFYEALELAKRRGVEVMVVNAYWYKYYATEVAHGGDPVALRQLATVFPTPRVTFYLEVSPEEAFARKALLSGYESGFPKERSREAFITFQRTAHEELDRLAAELGWIRLDGREPIARLTSTMIAQVAQEI